MNKFILLGAGNRARNIIELLPYGMITGVMDSDENKVGKSFCGLMIKKMSINEIAKSGSVAVLSFHDEKIIAQLEENNINYYTTCGRNSQNIFLRKDISDYIINDLTNRYYYDKRVKHLLYYEKGDLYRPIPKSEFNERLINEMKHNNVISISKMLEEKDNEQRDELFSDEYYDYRVGMQLAYRIIKEYDLKNECRLLDIACGHAEFIKKVMEIDLVNAEGIDSSQNRITYLEKQNVAVSFGMAENTNKPSNSYDIVTCFECLEHVIDPSKVIYEIYRILKTGGLTIITIPYKKSCDDDTHVRFFNENNIYTLLDPYFEIVNILIIPYIYGDSNNNIFVTAKKIKI